MFFFYSETFFGLSTGIKVSCFEYTLDDVADEIDSSPFGSMDNIKGDLIKCDIYVGF